MAGTARQESRSSTRLDDGDASASDRSVGVLEPEVGAADGGSVASIRRHLARARDTIAALVPNLTGLERRARGGRERGGDFRGARRKLQPQEHQSDRSTRRSRSTAAVCAVPRSSGSGVRGYVSTASTARSMAMSRSPRSPTWPAALFDDGQRSKWRSATPSASRIPARCRGSIGAVADRIPMDAIALHFHDTRGTAPRESPHRPGPRRARRSSASGGRARRLSRPRRARDAGKLATEDLPFTCTTASGITKPMSITGRRAAVNRSTNAIFRGADRGGLRLSRPRSYFDDGHAHGMSTTATDRYRAGSWKLAEAGSCKLEAGSSIQRFKDSTIRD